MPVLCWETVRFVGDRVAAVAAETLDAAEEAVGLIEVEYEQMAAVFDPLEAMQSSAPRLHADVTAYEGGPKDLLAVDVHNGLTRLAWRKGDVEQGFRAADMVLEHTFHIPARHRDTSNPTRQSSPSITTAGSRFQCRQKSLWNSQPAFQGAAFTGGAHPHQCSQCRRRVRRQRRC